jgi:hypothetical protein
MIDPEHLTDPDPRVAALLAACPILADYDHQYGRAAVRGIVPGVSDAHADQVISEITEALETAQTLHEQSRPGWGESLREEWIGHAKDCAWHVILVTENRTAAA